MPKLPTIYDLFLLLSTEAEDDARAKIVADVESAITTGGGKIERNDDWGRRALTFEIDHKTEADYRLLQFSGPTSLLETLEHSLRITDGVLRFRIIKVRPGTPPAPEPGSPGIPASVAAAPPDSDSGE